MHDARVRCVAVSPDGRTVLTGSEDKTAQLWDAETGKPLCPPMRHAGSVSAVAFSPNSDRVATVCGTRLEPGGDSGDNTARLWNAATGRPVGAPMQHDATVLAVKFSPDGAKVVTVSAYKARLWDAATGNPLGEPILDILDIAFSPDGRMLLTGATDGTARLWDAGTRKPLVDPIVHDGPVTHVMFSADGRRFFTQSDSLRVWDTATRKLICIVGEPVPNTRRPEYKIFTISSDGHIVLTGNGDHTARLWDAATGNALGDPMPHDNPVHDVAFSPNGKRFLTASSNTVRLWDNATRKTLGDPMRHDGYVQAIAFSSDGTKVLTGSSDRTARLWTATMENSSRLHGFNVGNEVRTIAVSPDGRIVFIGSRNGGNGYLWDAVNGKFIGEMHHGESFYAATFSPDGKILLTGGTGAAYLWDAATGTPLSEPIRTAEYGLVNVCFSLDGSKMATSSFKAAQIWDVATRKPIGATMRHDKPVRAVAFTPNGRTLRTGGPFGTCLWEIATGKLVLHNGLPNTTSGGYRSVAFSADQRTMILSSDSSTVRLLDVSTGKLSGEPIQHLGTDTVNVAFAISPDGHTILTGKDKTACLWDAHTGKPLGLPMQHADNVSAVTFTPNGRTIFTGTSDGTLHRWLVPQLVDNPELIRNWAAVKSGMVEEQGVPHQLSQAEWLQARDELEKFRGDSVNSN